MKHEDGTGAAAPNEAIFVSVMLCQVSMESVSTAVIGAY